MAIVRDNKSTIDRIRENFEYAKRTGNIGEIKSLQDELFFLKSDTGRGLVVNESPSKNQREVTDLIVEMDEYMSDLRDREFEEDEIGFGEGMEF